MDVIAPALPIYAIWIIGIAGGLLIGTVFGLPLLSLWLYGDEPVPKREEKPRQQYVITPRS